MVWYVVGEARLLVNAAQALERVFQRRQNPYPVARP